MCCKKRFNLCINSVASLGKNDRQSKKSTYKNEVTSKPTITNSTQIKTSYAHISISTTDFLNNMENYNASQSTYLNEVTSKPTITNDFQIKTSYADVQKSTTNFPNNMENYSATQSIYKNKVTSAPTITDNIQIKTSHGNILKLTTAKNEPKYDNVHIINVG